MSEMRVLEIEERVLDVLRGLLRSGLVGVLDRLLGLPSQEVQVLALLVSSTKPLSGMDLHRLSQDTPAVLKLGSVYVLLSRLEEKGYIQRKLNIRRERGGRDIVLYEPTKKGDKEVYDSMLKMGDTLTALLQKN